MSPTNLVAVVVLVVAILLILILRKRGEQRGAEAATPQFTVSGQTVSASDAAKSGVHVHVDNAIHASANIVSHVKGEEREVLNRWLGSSGGAWTEEQKEKFSAGFQRFLWDGEDLPTLLAGVGKILHLKYPTVSGTPLDIEVPPDVRAVFVKMTNPSAARVNVT